MTLLCSSGRARPLDLALQISPALHLLSVEQEMDREMGDLMGSNFVNVPVSGAELFPVFVIDMNVFHISRSEFTSERSLSSGDRDFLVFCIHRYIHFLIFFCFLTEYSTEVAPCQFPCLEIQTLF